MNHIRWAAWGVVDIENIPSDQTVGGNRQARRQFLKKARADLTHAGYTLHPGGSATKPFYMVMHDLTGNKHTAAGPDAFKKVCAWVLERIGDAAHVGSEDGGVRRAGDEAEDDDVTK